ncbi:MAG: hypothetical protein OJF52_002881 [Nitrospira sp.]|jgi:WD40 repeat protein|nr:MAG: hypothetical protein OJF52_002881 [Nitrospira sp.]
MGLHRGTIGPSTGDTGFSDLVAGFVLVIGGGFIAYGILFQLILPTLTYCGVLFMGVASAPWLFTGPLWLNLIWDVLFGAAAGFLFSFMRYRYALKSRVVEELIDAAMERDTISATHLGFAYVVVHIVFGALCGLAVGAIGLFEPPQLISGAWHDIRDGTAYGLLIQAGYFGGSGGGGLPPLDEFLTLLLAIIIAAVCITSILSLLATLAMSEVGSGLASGALKGFGKSLGISLLLVLRRFRYFRPIELIPDPSAEWASNQHWFGQSLRTGMAVGAVGGLVTTLAALGCARLAEFAITDDVRSTVDFEEIHTIPAVPNSKEVTSLVFTSDGQYLFANMRDAEWSRMIDMERGDELKNEVKVCGATTNNRVAFIRNYRVYLIYLNHNNTARELEEIHSRDAQCAFSTDGSWIGLNDYKTIRILDVASSREVFGISTSDDYINLAFRSDGALVTTGLDNKVQVWDVDEGEARWSSPLTTWGSVALSPNGTVLAYHAYQGQVKFLHLENETEFERAGVSFTGKGMAFNRDGQVLALGRDHRVSLWYVGGARELMTLSLPDSSDEVSAVGFSSDGRFLAVGTYGGDIRIWRTRTPTS